MAAFDLLGRRWTLRILWELRDGPVGFRALRQQCDDVSPTVLKTRLGELREAGLVEQDETKAYGLSALGRELSVALQPMLAWSDRWLGRP
jgi:DNA-binding HxlR family transcriptional regulator